MILAALVAASLIVPVSVDTIARTAPDRDATELSLNQKRAVIRPLISSANECIARTVSGNPKFKTLSSAGGVNELIVESVQPCIDEVRAMIDAYDRLFGTGAGETFFMGAYLDDLPGAVDQLVRDSR